MTTAAPADTTHILSVLVENHFGVLARISGMFAARSFNIDSLTVGPTHDPTCSRMTVAVKGDARILDQIRKQLEKFAEVVIVEDLTESTPYIARELVLVKVSIEDEERRDDLIDLVHEFRPEVIDLSPDTITMQIVGLPEQIERFLALLAPHGLREVARTGVVALSRGSSGLHTRFLNS